MTPIPAFGYGTYRRDGEVAYACVLAALEMGYRHIDTAEMYGNEREVGRAIKDSGLKRSDIFVTTKCGPEHFGKGQVLKAAQGSLAKLGLDQVDLYLLHWPSPGDEYDAHDYVAQLGEVHAKGLAAQIGVSNFTKKYIDIALKLLGPKAIATNQVEMHVLMQNRPISDYCKAKNIPITAYCPLARGALSNHAGMKALALKHDATPEQVGLAFLLAEGHIVIPSSSKRERIESNWDAQRLTLSAEEMQLIREMDEGRRLINGGWCPKWDT
ncbi:aldo/keto reductase [Aestuariivirga litoralis]|uniref:aldo/keto reductase n=1 Tax=Aestuariivirga litoralis TaxID=2650924 RepID=UPI0018C5E0D0|nr:aldo/keto reductase [Aestuariivirga litoralis]MBG1233796.1 aldo/keto reductase [Aestuariivirga litoralis]